MKALIHVLILALTGGSSAILITTLLNCIESAVGPRSAILASVSILWLALLTAYFVYDHTLESKH